MIPIWYGICLAMGAAYFGFWFGRSRNWGLLAVDERVSGKHLKAGETKRSDALTDLRKDGGRQILPHIRYLASPTGGKVTHFPAEEKTGVKIETSETKLYSPSPGRVLSVAPRGNAFLIMTDWGDEVEVRACNSEDDLLDRYFRPRVVRGEIIRRGKLLLEYDRDKLTRECEDTAVYLTARGEDNGKLEFVREEEVKAGDALFWVN